MEILGCIEERAKPASASIIITQVTQAWGIPRSADIAPGRRLKKGGVTPTTLALLPPKIPHQQDSGPKKKTRDSKGME